MVNTFSYPHSATTLASLQAGLSPIRLNRYLGFTNQNLAKALELHSWNSFLGASLHFPIQHLEILLRNASDRELNVIYAQADWFNLVPNNPRPYNYLSGRIAEIQRDLTGKRRNPNSPPDVVAGLTLGFWVALFVDALDRDLWRTGLFRAAPHLPNHLKRRDFHRNLKRIKELRNRIAHHEPIFHRNLASAHQLIIDTTSYICPDSANWISHHSQFSAVFTNPPQLTTAELQHLQNIQQNDTYFN